MDSQTHQEIHPDSLREQPPETLLSFYNAVSSVIATYGWFIVGFIVASLYAWHNWLSPKYQQWQEEKENRAYAAKYHKDPDSMLDRQARIEAARKRMQQQNDRKAAEFAERQREREEQKRREKQEEMERLLGDGPGRRLGSALDGTANTTADSQGRKVNPRSDYNPLVGAGGSGGYRAPRRSCPGGGCG